MEEGRERYERDEGLGKEKEVREEREWRPLRGRKGAQGLTVWPLASS